MHSSDGTRHWEKTSDSNSAPPQTGWRPLYSQARAVDIEMTAYALLTYCQLKNISMGLPIAKWIVAQRNANGGFSSTQVLCGLNQTQMRQTPMRHNRLQRL